MLRLFIFYVITDMFGIKSTILLFFYLSLFFLFFCLFMDWSFFVLWLLYIIYWYKWSQRILQEPDNHTWRWCVQPHFNYPTGCSVETLLLWLGEDTTSPAANFGHSMPPAVLLLPVFQGCMASLCQSLPPSVG